MIFASDNWAGAAEPIVAALAEQARRGGPAYGGDALSKAVEARFCEIFERAVAVFFVGTGTAANALAIANYCRPGSIVFGHTQAHINVDEANGLEFLGGGVKVVGLDGEGGKLTPSTLLDGLAAFPERGFHHGQPVAVSLSQANELGQAYSPAEVAAVSGIAKDKGMAVHMDGARFAGAVAGLGVSPAELTWKAGVDVLSFGGTKNGCLAAEAVVFFDPAEARNFGFARQRIGHGFSKAWFIAAQFQRYLQDDTWLVLAGRANGRARELADALRSSSEARLALEPSANEVLTVVTIGLDERLKAAGAIYYPWSMAGMPAEAMPGPGEVLVRFVTSFQTSEEEVAQFAALVSGSSP